MYVYIYTSKKGFPKEVYGYGVIHLEFFYIMIWNYLYYQTGHWSRFLLLLNVSLFEHFNSEAIGPFWFL